MGLEARIDRLTRPLEDGVPKTIVNDLESPGRDAVVMRGDHVVERDDHLDPIHGRPGVVDQIFVDAGNRIVPERKGQVLAYTSARIVEILPILQREVIRVQVAIHGVVLVVSDGGLPPELVWIDGAGGR